LLFGSKSRSYSDVAIASESGIGCGARARMLYVAPFIKPRVAHE